jgi:hypothetical protein
MSPKELVLTLDPINKNRLSEIDQEIKLYDDWHQKGIHNILNKEFKKLTPIQLKEAYKTPKKFLSKKNLKNVNWPTVSGSNLPMIS